MQMAKEHLYSVFSVGHDRWHVVKYHRTTRIEEGHYEVSRTPRNEWLCDCYAGHNSTCRHREMVFMFNRSHKTGSGALMDYDKDKPTWVKNEST